MSTLSSASGSRTSRSFPQLEPSDTMWLHTSPFDGWRKYRRHATIHFVAIDNPWDDYNKGNEGTHILIDALSTFTLEQSQCISIARNAVTHKPLSYILGKEAAPFSSLLCTLAYAGLHPVPDASLYTTHTWALKWIGRPVNSDFSKVNPRAFQKLNHFPQTWRLGKKDELQRHMRRVEKECGAICPEGWIIPDELDECLAAIRSECNTSSLFICKPTTSACGRGIVVIQGSPTVSLPLQVNNKSNENNNNNVIINELNAVNMVWANATTFDRKGNRETSNNDVSISNINNNVCNEENVMFNKQHNISALRERAQRSLRFSRPLRWIVQRYIDDPYLIHGHKFDLRLYVVVTSYAPLRLYVYNEGLVRIATSPYYTKSNNVNTKENHKQYQHDTELHKMEEESMKMNEEASDIADVCCLTAHLTNFTVNKESDLFVKPTKEVKTSSNDIVSDQSKHNTSNKVDASKWTFSALRTYLEENGMNWDATMESVHKLLRSVFAGITPHVCEELEIIDDKLHVNHNQKEKEISIDDKSSNIDSKHTTRAPCTFHGIGPFFQIFGVDVLLRQPTHEQPTLLVPVLMEVNIMPSLSTHYSWLDQHIKGNFIADTLTLIGLTPLSLSIYDDKINNRNMLIESENDKNMKHLQNDIATEFLSTLTDVHEIEACMTAEEELLRSLPNFTRLYPSCHVKENEKQWLLSTTHTSDTSDAVRNHDDNNNNKDKDNNCNSVNSEREMEEVSLHYSVLNQVLHKL